MFTITVTITIHVYYDNYFDYYYPCLLSLLLILSTFTITMTYYPCLLLLWLLLSTFTISINVYYHYDYYYPLYITMTIPINVYYYYDYNTIHCYYDHPRLLLLWLLQLLIPNTLRIQMIRITIYYDNDYHLLLLFTITNPSLLLPWII